MLHRGNVRELFPAFLSVRVKNDLFQLDENIINGFKALVKTHPT